MPARWLARVSAAAAHRRGRRWPGRHGYGAAWAVALGALLGAAPARAETVDYLYVEANEGSSAGGHVALRVGDEVFHFQQDGTGLLRLHGDRARLFRIRYALLENRPVHVTHIAVSADTAARLRQAFVDRQLAEAAEHERAAALEADVAIFARWRAHAAGVAVSVPVRAAGYFLPAEFHAGGAAAGSSMALAALRARVSERYGAGALAARRAAVRDEARALVWRAAAPAPPSEGGATVSSSAPVVSTRYRELIEQLTALELLSAAPGLRDDALLRAVDVELDAAQRGALRALRDRTSAALVDLLASSRPDWGYALLLGMARLAAMETSLATGSLAVLDAWPADAPTPPVPGDPAQRAAFFAALQQQASAALLRARDTCLGGAAEPCREADYTRLETVLNRVADLRRAAAGAPPPRLAADPLLPARPAWRRDLVATPPTAVEAAVQSAAAGAAAARYADELRAVRGYHLTTRNCVSELFATIDSALGDASGDAEAAGQGRALGGAVGREPWNAIPFVSALAVGNAYRVAGRETWPSYLQQARAAQAPTWAAWLRESNALTSTLYRPGVEDSSFLFFTDHAPAVRPLLGAANLTVGLVDGAIGLATWPVDGGRRAARAARGLFYSAPELVFINLRKGTTAWLTAAELNGVE